MNRVPSRSPHPYHRKSLSSPTSPVETDSASADSTLDPKFATHDPHEAQESSQTNSFAPSTASQSSSEDSGTEADDEKETGWHHQHGPHLSRRRTLPAPPRDKGRWEVDDDERPREGNRIADGKEATPTGGNELDSAEKAKAQRKNDKLGGRKKIVFFRRSLEVLLMVALCGIVCIDPAVFNEVKIWKKELGAFLATLAFITTIQPSYSFLRNPRTVSLPPTLDPSSLLYPILFPPLLALSLTHQTSTYLIPGLICSLASIPPGLYQRTLFTDGSLRYIFTITPVLCSSIIGREAAEEYMFMPIIHANLVSLGMDLVIPSLSTTETRLLATSLVALLYNAAASQMVILKVILWWTGGALISLGKRFMELEVELERSVVIARGRMSARSRRERTDGKKAILGNTTDEESMSPPRLLSRRSPNRFPHAVTTRSRSLLDVIPNSLPNNIQFWKYAYAIPVYVILAVSILFFERPYIARYALSGTDPFFWAAGYLFSGLPSYPDFVTSLGLKGIRGIDIEGHEHRWGPNFRLILAGYWVTAVLVGIWFVVTLGRGVRVPIEKLGLEIHGPGWLGLAEVARGRAVEVDTRRKVFHGLVVAMFLPTIFLDPPFVAIAFVIALALFLVLDILRASLLPPLSRPLSIFLAPYVDGRDLRGPIVVSHVFLLIGCAIPLWLSLAGSNTSEILAKPDNTLEAPFGVSWMAPARELAMISGIVCVGMGDAAASLIGRRFGKHKWGWSGGKSLEGSLAFTVAVCLGLSLAKFWLVAGAFVPGQGGIGRGGLQALREITLRGSTDFLVKSLGVGAIGSLLEAVITGGNDNVMIPVVLWLAIRAVHI